MTKSFINQKQLISKVTHVLATRSFLLFFIGFAALSGFLVINIGALANAEPSQTQIDERLAAQKKSTLDKKGIDVIESLKSRSTETDAKFDSTRTNPFE
jgi:hypothetical protein